MELRTLIGLTVLVGGVPASATTMSIAVRQAEDVTLIETGVGALLVTDPDDGGPAYVDAGQKVAFMRTPMAREGAVMADAFYVMCGDLSFDRAKFDLAAAQSGLGLKRKEFTLLPSVAKGQPMEIVDWQSGSVRTSLWPERLAELNGRVTVSPSVGQYSTGRYSASKKTVSECGILFDTKDFREPSVLIEHLTLRLGMSPTKMASGKQFADGYWQLPDKDGFQYKVQFTVLNMAEASQVVHIALLKSAPKK